MLETIQSLRRHYPDQVRGYDLSRFLDGTPWFSAAKVGIFSFWQDEFDKTFCSAEWQVGIKRENPKGFIKQKTLQLVDFQIEGFGL